MTRPARVVPRDHGFRLNSDGDLYGRWCPYCGYVEVGDDRRIYTEFRRCPRCRS